jgi:hypothetical protein
MLLAFGKFVVISFAAAVGAILPWIVLGFQLDDPFGWLWLLVFSLPPTLIIGLPVAFLCFVLTHRKIANSPGIVFLMANLAGVVMVLTCYFAFGYNSMFSFGLPAVLAANVYAILGWFWVVKPMGLAAAETPEAIRSDA